MKILLDSRYPLRDKSERLLSELVHLIKERIDDVPECCWLLNPWLVPTRFDRRGGSRREQTCQRPHRREAD